MSLPSSPTKGKTFSAKGPKFSARIWKNISGWMPDSTATCDLVKLMGYTHCDSHEQLILVMIDLAPLIYPARVYIQTLERVPLGAPTPPSRTLPLTNRKASRRRPEETVNRLAPRLLGNGTTPSRSGRRTAPRRFQRWLPIQRHDPHHARSQARGGSIVCPVLAQAIYAS